VEGIATIPYAIPNILVDCHNVNPGIPVSFWRSVGYSQNTFFAESFLDEWRTPAARTLWKCAAASSPIPARAGSVELAAARPAGASRSPLHAHGISLAITSAASPRRWRRCR